MRPKNIIISSLIVFTLFSCKEIRVTKSNNNKNSNKDSNYIIKKTESLIWKDDTVQIFLKHPKNIEGEDRIEIFTGNNKMLLNFLNDDGGYITSPFILKKDNEIFIVFFEVWNGSGFLSKKHIYHFNSKKKELKEIGFDNIKEILSKIKHKDSLYTRKGFFYKDYEFKKSCFDENNDLPFSLVLFNYTHPKMNKGLEGYRILKGKFSIVNIENKYFFKADSLKLTIP